MTRLALLVLECDADSDGELQEALDGLRESVLLKQNFGITLYRATAVDIQAFPLAENGNGVVDSIPTDEKPS